MQKNRVAFRGHFTCSNIFLILGKNESECEYNNSKFCFFTGLSLQEDLQIKFRATIDTSKLSWRQMNTFWKLLRFLNYANLLLFPSLLTSKTSLN